MDIHESKQAMIDRKQELKYKKALSSPKVRGVGRKILENAIRSDRSRRNRSISEAGQLAKDAAQTAIRRIRGTTPVNGSSFVNGIGPGLRLGPGRHRFINGRWVTL